MSQFPPFPPPGTYSPSRSYGDRPRFPPAGPPLRDYPPYAYPNHLPPPPPPPPNAYRPFDAYSAESRPPYPYEQPRRAYDQEHYDPYQPSTNNAYDSGGPQSRLPPPGYPPSARPTPFIPHRSPPRSKPSAPLASKRLEAPRGGDVPELTLLTDVIRADLDGVTVAIYSLPSSHLPVEKYVALNFDDAMDLHRHFCTRARSIWYADGSSRAGEGWSAAIEWMIDEGQSGKKMRGCVGEADALDSELGGLCKAAEGFQEGLHQSLKDGKPISHDLIVFCDSQAAIVSIDTSSRSESIKFDKLWREVCTEFPRAVMKLVWLPRTSSLEGHVLADKIAVVGASNAYLKKKKDGLLKEIYTRYGGGEPAPPGSSEAGPWQRGDADPSRRKNLFERPRIAALDLKADVDEISMQVDSKSTSQPARLPVPAFPNHEIMPEPEEDSGQPREGSIFVTHFPDEVSAKDIGILFAQFGNIVAVDIYHISSHHPRFAFVAYTETKAGTAAIANLNGKSIDLDSDFARANHHDLDVWRKWSGKLTVVRSEPPRLVPLSLAAHFPNLPDWAAGKDLRSDEAENMEVVDMQIRQERDSSAESLWKKRTHVAARHPDEDGSSSESGLHSPSPHKRARQGSHQGQAHQLPDSVAIKMEPTTDGQPNGAATQTTQPLSHTTPLMMPPFPPMFKSDDPTTTHQGPSHLSPQVGPQSASPLARLPPTPSTVERPALASNVQARSPPRQQSLDPVPQSAQVSSSSKRPLTNSASEPQEYPIKIGAKTLRALIALVRTSFVKVDDSNWIAHSCFIASDLDQARRSLKDDLYATDGAFLTGRDLEQTLAARGFTPQRVDNFINKVLKLLDGIALAEEEEDANAANSSETVDGLEKELVEVLSKYPDQTKEALQSAAKLMEYLMRGKEAQEQKRLEVERRVKVLEGMVKVGEVVGGVVRFLLTEDKP